MGIRRTDVDVYRRRDFANGQAYGATLVAVNDNVNQSKGDRDPAARLPALATARCTYVVDWVR